MAIKEGDMKERDREMLPVRTQNISEITPTETEICKTGYCPSNSALFEAIENTEECTERTADLQCATNDGHSVKEGTTERDNGNVMYHQVNDSVWGECHTDKLECKMNSTECFLQFEPHHIHSKNKCHDLKKSRKALQEEQHQFETYQNERRNKKSKSSCMFLLLICLLILNSSPRYPYNEKHFHDNFLPVDVKSWKKKTKLRTVATPVIKQDTFTLKKLKCKLFEIIFTLFYDIKKFQRDLIVVPLNSLDQFFRGLESGSSLEDSMNFEWARLRSFASFTCPSDVSPVTLSRGGFFYTGRGSEVKCYSCGVRYNQCSSDHNVFEVHRRISPNCRHLTGNDQRNVPIGHRNSVSPQQQSGASFTSETPQHSGQQCNNGHQSGLSNMSTAYTSNAPNGANFERQQARLPQMDHITSERNTNDHRVRSALNTEQPTMSRQPYENNNANRESGYTSYTAPPVRTPTQSNRSGVSSATINKLSPLGVNFDKPRYPQYAVLTVRMSTYNGWPATQIPRKMAEAGFIYAGYADYARCFFCGGGLRNWEEGDDPWIEHARWFPRCAYVRQNKGDQFVQLVHERLQEMVRSTAEESMTPAPRNEGLPTQKTSAYQEVTQHTANDTQNQETNLKSLPCYQSVLELGYASDTIEQIIHQLIRKGVKEVTSADILDIIFKMEEDGRTVKEATIVSENIVHRKESQSVEEAKSLMEENRRLREQRLCMICVEKDSCITFLPCGHLVCCEECAPAMKKCPKCQQIVQGSIKTWLV